MNISTSHFPLSNFPPYGPPFISFSSFLKNNPLSLLSATDMCMHVEPSTGGNKCNLLLATSPKAVSLTQQR